MKTPEFEHWLYDGPSSPLPLFSVGFIWRLLRDEVSGYRVGLSPR